MNTGANVIQAQVLPTLATASYYSAGLVVSFCTATGDMPMVQSVSVGSTNGIGIIVSNEKTNKYYANNIVGVALDGTIISVSAGAPIMRNQVVGYGSTTAAGLPQVTAMGSGNGIGIAIDIAAAAGDIIRVMVKAGIAYNAGL